MFAVERFNKHTSGGLGLAPGIILYNKTASPENLKIMANLI